MAMTTPMLALFSPQTCREKQKGELPFWVGTGVTARVCNARLPAAQGTRLGGSLWDRTTSEPSRPIFRYQDRRVTDLQSTGGGLRSHQSACLTR